MSQNPLTFYLDKSSPQTWKSAIAFTRAVGEEARAAGLSKELIELITIRVSQINGCAYCLNLHTKAALMLAEAAAQPSDAASPALTGFFAVARDELLGTTYDGGAAYPQYGEFPLAQPGPLPAPALPNARLKLRGSTKEQT